MSSKEAEANAGGEAAPPYPTGQPQPVPPPTYGAPPPQYGAAAGAYSGGVYSQPGVPQTGQPGQTVIVVGGPGPYGGQIFSSQPQRMKCFHCNADVVTTIAYETGLLTWLMVGGICLVLPFGCCFIPFCIDGLKDVRHTCPNCNQFLGQYKHIR